MKDKLASMLIMLNILKFISVIQQLYRDYYKNSIEVNKSLNKIFKIKKCHNEQIH